MKKLVLFLCLAPFFAACTPDTPENHQAHEAGRVALKEGTEALQAARNAIKEAVPVIRQEVEKLSKNFQGKFEGRLKSGGRMILDFDGNGTYKQFIRRPDGTEEVSSTGKWILDTDRVLRLTDDNNPRAKMEFKMTHLNELQLLDPSGKPVEGTVLKYIVFKDKK